MKEKNKCCDGIADLLSPEFFKALSDPNRATILDFLTQCGRECTVGEVADCCPVDVSVVSRHLAVLKNAGVLQARKQGREVFYSVRIFELAAMLRNLADALEACCPDGSCNIGSLDHELSKKAK